MKPNRLRVLLAGLAGLVLLAVLWHFLRADEPAYQGKTVSAWFKEYAYFSNAPPAGYYAMPYSVNARIVRWVGTPGSNSTAIRTAPVAGLRGPYSLLPPDPALEALQALGSNVVPCLVHHLRYGPLDRAYERTFTNFPGFMQRRLPNPAEKRWYRLRALQTLAVLKDTARGATPALLDMLREPEPLLRPLVLSTLRSIYADGYSISGLLIQLGQQKRHAEILEIARETRWEGREIAHLFGEILQSTNAALHRDAITLLEAAGERAAPALDTILAALQSPDREVRYLSARSLEKIFSSALPADQRRIKTALETSINDDNEMVRNVVRRALQNQ